MFLGETAQIMHTECGSCSTMTKSVFSKTPLPEHTAAVCKGVLCRASLPRDHWLPSKRLRRVQFPWVPGFLGPGRFSHTTCTSNVNPVSRTEQPAHHPRPDTQCCSQRGRLPYELVPCEPRPGVASLLNHGRWENLFFSC